MAEPRARPLQDFLAWHSFGTAELWQQIRENPGLASELLCQHFSLLGAINPGEPSSASLAAAALVAEHGPQGTPMLSKQEIDQMYKHVKASIHACMPAYPAVTTASSFEPSGDHRYSQAVTTASILHTHAFSGSGETAEE